MKIKFIALIIIFFLFASSGSLKANENRGAEFVIQKTDGHRIRGELIAVKANSLLLLESESAADVSVGGNQRGLREIKL